MTARELATEARCPTIPPGGSGRQRIVRPMRVILALLVNRLVTTLGGGGRVGSIPSASRTCVNRPDYPIALNAAAMVVQSGRLSCRLTTR